ncbi:hypothetical protein B0H13DRAFT_2235091 [Mycena leptocephala]|nr:hypothetical protein B0H13DRAFT_2235091 [Mycena leptocephala]
MQYLRKSGEQPWSLRRRRVAKHLLGEGIMLAGLQEALVRQVHDLAALFGEDCNWVGVGRDDGVEVGEYSLVFYKKSVTHAFHPPRFPDAGSYCVGTTIRLQSRDDGKEFTVLNTHMDNQSEAQRRHAASFNPRASPDGRDSGAYKIATVVRLPGALPDDFAANYSVDPSSPPFVLHDLRAHTPRRAGSANYATLTGFTAPDDKYAVVEPHQFCLWGWEWGLQATGYKVASVLTDDGVLASDHRPVNL